MIGRRVCSRCRDVYQENRFGRPAAICGACVDRVGLGADRISLGEDPAKPPGGFPWGITVVFGLLVGAAWLAGEK